MSDPGLALQKALFDRLSVPGAISCPVFDYVPEKTPLPYVVMDTEVSSNTTPISGKKRENRLFYIGVWSNHKGQSEVKRINAEIAAALDEVPLPLSVGTAISVRVLRTETNREPDGKTFMGSVVVRVITQH
ncbi:DUF3168 domain-containing protein [Pseudomonas sp. 11/12A]|uniref:DUF3168 domain-containing protein n=1 Tax=Pseudomonas sp. 11/12A TaxID=1506582 RepID=UPI000647B9BF|nr:DUF3168 domain-containing protein [Pseudomonas sp. 11/12A]